jgi:hypothetical protein
MRNVYATLAAAAFSALAVTQAFAGGAADVSRSDGPSFEDRQNDAWQFNHASSFGYQGAASSYSEPQSFKIIYLGDVASSSQAALIKDQAAGNPAKLEAIRSAILGDEAVAREFRQRGIDVKNVVGASNPINGRAVYYVK